jgi:hypothetical protein
VSNFTAAFTRRYGTPPGRYVRDRRLEGARDGIVAAGDAGLTADGPAVEAAVRRSRAVR